MFNKKILFVFFIISVVFFTNACEDNNIEKNKVVNTSNNNIRDDASYNPYKLDAQGYNCLFYSCFSDEVTP